MALTSIALFGASGQLGQNILSALISSSSPFKITALIPPGDDLTQFHSRSNKLVVKHFDAKTLSREELAKDLKGIDAIVCALNGPALNAQPTIQDAGADAGVKRFYPSEFGLHNVYRKEGDGWGYVHPLWDQKAQINEKALLHPAIEEGKMSYTLIGCGDFYNQDREKVWCPWTQAPSSLPNGAYTFHVIGDPGAKADFTHLSDFAKFLVATLEHPEKSENKSLNFVSDTISHSDIAELLRKYSGKDVKIEKYNMRQRNEIVKDPSTAPKELTESNFPVDFWFLVKGFQGLGEFRRPRGEVHNGLFSDVQATTFQKYFEARFGVEGKGKGNGKL